MLEEGLLGLRRGLVGNRNLNGLLELRELRLLFDAALVEHSSDVCRILRRGLLSDEGLILDLRLLKDLFGLGVLDLINRYILNELIVSFYLLSLLGLFGLELVHQLF